MFIFIQQYGLMTEAEVSSMTLGQRIQARKDIEALRARIAARRCAYCNGLACGMHADDRTWSRR